MLRSLLRAVVLVAVPSLAAAQPIQPVQVLHRFTNAPSAPNGGMAALPDGSLYGVTADAIYRVAPGSGAVTIVARFTDGWGADSPLVRGPDGALYGTTPYGGAGGRGTVFRFDPATGELRTLHAFDGAREGSFPVGGLTLANGFFYIVTNTGFVRTDPATGATVTVYNAPTPGSGDPTGPGGLTSPLTAAPDGRLYGTSQYGPSFAEGTLYRFDPQTRAVTILRTFTTTRTQGPLGRLLLTADGRLIGVSRGALGAGGSVWRFDPATDAFDVLHEFSSGDGARPGPIMVAPDGSLFGTTDRPNVDTGLLDDAIAIFRLRPGPGPYTFETVRTFDPATTGSGVRVELALGADGLIYGYAQRGGSESAGTIYRFDPASNPLVFTVLYAFPQTSTWAPSTPAALANGFLFGTTSRGGASQRGAVYRLNAATGEVDIVADMPGPSLVSSSTFNSSFAVGANGDLYGESTTANATTIERRIVRVAASTLAVTLPLQQTAVPGLGLDVDGTPVRGANGAFYFLRGTNVMRYDPVTNTLAVAGTPPNPPGLNFTQMTPLLAASDGRIYVGVTSFVSFFTRPPTVQITLRLMRVATTSTELEEVVNLGAAEVGLGLVQTPDGGIYIAGYRNVFAVDPLAGTFRTVCAVDATPASYWTATDDNRLVGVIAPSGSGRHQRLGICTPATGAIEVRALPPGIGLITVPLVSSGGWLYGATIDYGFPSSFSPVPTLSQPGGALIRLSLGQALPAIDTDADGLPNTWETVYGLDPDSSAGAAGAGGDPDGDGRTNAQELADGTHPRGFLTRYFAEGASNQFFRTRFDFGNPSSARSALVQLRFLTDAGVRLSQDVVVPQSGHASFDPGTLPELTHASYSTVVESDVTIAADRTMTWDATGYGSHQETGVTSPATTWYFAEGSTSGTVRAVLPAAEPAGDAGDGDRPLPAAERAGADREDLHAATCEPHHHRRRRPGRGARQHRRIGGDYGDGPDRRRAGDVLHARRAAVQRRTRERGGQQPRAPVVPGRGRDRPVLRSVRAARQPESDAGDRRGRVPDHRRRVAHQDLHGGRRVARDDLGRRRAAAGRLGAAPAGQRRRVDDRAVHERCADRRRAIDVVARARDDGRFLVRGAQLARDDDDDDELARGRRGSGRALGRDHLRADRQPDHGPGDGARQAALRLGARRFLAGAGRRAAEEQAHALVFVQRLSARQLRLRHSRRVAGTRPGADRRRARDLREPRRPGLVARLERTGGALAVGFAFIIPGCGHPGMVTTAAARRTSPPTVRARASPSAAA